MQQSPSFLPYDMIKKREIISLFRKDLLGAINENNRKLFKVKPPKLFYRDFIEICEILEHLSAETHGTSSISSVHRQFEVVLQESADFLASEVCLFSVFAYQTKSPTLNDAIALNSSLSLFAVALSTFCALSLAASRENNS